MREGIFGYIVTFGPKDGRICTRRTAEGVGISNIGTLCGVSAFYEYVGLIHGKYLGSALDGSHLVGYGSPNVVRRHSGLGLIKGGIRIVQPRAESECVAMVSQQRKIPAIRILDKKFVEVAGGFDNDTRRCGEVD